MIQKSAGEAALRRRLGWGVMMCALLLVTPVGAGEPLPMFGQIGSEPMVGEDAPMPTPSRPRFPGWGAADQGVSGPAVVVSTGTPKRYLTPGSALYYAQADGSGNFTCGLIRSQNETIIFDENIIPSGAARFVEVHFSSQVAMLALSANNSIDLICRASSGTATVPCSALSIRPAVIRGLGSATENPLGMISYHGFVDLGSGGGGKEVYLQVGFYGGTPDVNDGDVVGQACFSNLIVRY